MLMTTDACQTVLPEMPASKVSVFLDLLTAYRAAKKKGLKADELDSYGPQIGPHLATSGPDR